MPANPSDAIVIVLDIGKSVSTLHDCEEKTFFDHARDCVSWIIQRKIISESIDVISLLLIGSEESENLLSGYDNVCVKFDFQLVSWDLLKFIETEVKTTLNESDWFNGLKVSLEMLRIYEEYNTVQNKKIVIFSDFTKPASENIRKIVKRIQAQNIDITIIGPVDLHSSDECDNMDEPEVKKKKPEKSVKRQEGEKVVYELWKMLSDNICICDFESALKQLCSYTPKPKRISYWNCMMDIGEVYINISVAKKTDQKPTRKFTTKCVKPDEERQADSTSTQDKCDKTTKSVRDKVLFYKHETGQGNELVDVEVKSEDTIEGFRYGTTVIPFSKEDKAAMEYKSGPKSFSVIGFTHMSNVPYYLLSGECSYLVVPRNMDKNAEVALSAIIQGMKKCECLAIVRRVYSDDRGLSIGILYPVIEEIFSDESDDVCYREYLLFVELAFKDDLKSIVFPSLEKVAKDITQEQYDVVDSLIEEMDLMRAGRGLRGEPCEAFDFPFLHDFKEQFFHYCVIQKGLYPDKDLPTSLPPYIRNFTKMPKRIEKNCESIFKEIKKRFKIRRAADGNKARSHWNQRITRENEKKQWNLDEKIEHFTESFIEEDPNCFNRTWLRLFAKGFPTDEELDKVFGTFEKLNETEKSQMLQSFAFVIARVHKMYLKCNPNEYNRWLLRFKTYLNGKRDLETKFWEVIIGECVGLISKQENHYSKVTEEEAEKFLCTDIEKANCPEQAQIPEYELLDELRAEQMDVDFEFS